MSDNVNTSDTLADALTDEVINEGFEIARSNRTGLLQVVNMGDPRAAFEGYKMGWLDMRIDATASTITANITDSVTTIPVAEGGKFRAGMTVSFEDSDEVILVTVVTGNNLTVTRGFGGTTAEAQTSGDTLTIDSVGREENSLAKNDTTYQPDKVENFFQTMDTAIEFSRRAMATTQFGSTNDMAFQVSERIRQLTIQMDRALIRGRKATATIDGKEITYTGGVKYFLDQAGTLSTDAAAAALTLEMINVLNAAIVAAGGTANVIVVSITKARQLQNLMNEKYSSERLSDFVTDEGGLITLPSDLPVIGNITRIVIDTNMSDTELFLLDASNITIVPMASGNANDSGAWRTLDATQKGQDGESVRVVGDFAIEFRQSKTHAARLYNLAK